MKGNIVVNDEEIDCRLEDRRNLDLNATCMVNWCQEKDAGVLFRLNYSLYQHASVILSIC